MQQFNTQVKISKQKQQIPFQKLITKMSQMVSGRCINGESIKQRFKKYKQLSSTNSQEHMSMDEKIQQIFSGFTYKSQFQKKDLKLSLSTDISKISSISDLSEMSIVKVESFESFLFLSDQQQQIEISQQQISHLQPPIFQQNHSKPFFIRKFNKLNSRTPNIYHPRFNLEEEFRNIKEIIQTALQSIHSLYRIGTEIIRSKNRNRMFCVLNKDHLKVKYFMSCGWQKQRFHQINDEDMIEIKSYSNFSISQSYQCNFKGIFSELNSLTTRTVQLITNLNKLNQENQSIQTYNSMRIELIQIEQKLLQLSNLIYFIGNSVEQYPQIYYVYYSILEGNYDCKGVNSSYILSIYEQFKHLWRSGEAVTCSQIGRAVFSRLQKICQRVVK